MKVYTSLTIFVLAVCCGLSNIAFAKVISENIGDNLIGNSVGITEEKKPVCNLWDHHNILFNYLDKDEAAKIREKLLEKNLVIFPNAQTAKTDSTINKTTSASFLDGENQFFLSLDLTRKADGRSYRLHNLAAMITWAGYKHDYSINLIVGNRSYIDQYGQYFISQRIPIDTVDLLSRDIIWDSKAERGIPYDGILNWPIDPNKILNNPLQYRNLEDPYFINRIKTGILNLKNCQELLSDITSTDVQR